MLGLDLREPKGEVNIQALSPMYVPGGGGIAASFSF